MKQLFHNKQTKKPGAATPGFFYASPICNDLRFYPHPNCENLNNLLLLAEIKVTA